MRRHCRLWWPKQLLTDQELPSPCRVLLGWFVTCSPLTFDIVVAFTCSEVLLSSSNPSLEDIIHDTHGSMPTMLEDKSVFSVLGLCIVDPTSNGLIAEVEYDKRKFSDSGNNLAEGCTSLYKKKNECRSCSSLQHESLRKSSQSFFGKSNWVLLMFDSTEQNDARSRGVPRLHHIHWNGVTMSDYDVHVIVYETPSYGDHHFSLSNLGSNEEAKPSIKNPKWVDELHKKKQFVELDTVIMAINCATSAKRIFETLAVPRRSLRQLSIFSMFLIIIGHLFSKFIASFSTVVYIALQFCQAHVKYKSESWMHMTLANIFRTAWINIQIKCCQILYWPIFLQDKDLRSRSCVEYAEKAAMHRHSMWSTLFVDILLGNLVGWPLLHNSESICLSIVNFTHGFSTFLRSGCVWLMGDPAGFKLNAELANVLGIFSLNAIQIWSTLWIFVGFITNYIIQGLAILGIICGFTAFAAMIIDMIVLATLHVSILHRLISLVYSSQIQALAALWRLFSGRKWNPLRQRLDSFDYTVKQHIVGSLLFTPLILLLPTTSVFYIFFSITETTINLICVLIEVIISVIHATPYVKILLWLVRPQRFPSGIWFEICGSRSNVSPEDGVTDEMNSSKESVHLKDFNRKKSSILVSFLHSNYLSIGKVSLPHYRSVLLGVSGSSIYKVAYGIVIGKRMQSLRGTLLPSPMPWMSLPYKEYWCLCHDSLIACFR
ncbi:N-acetylglucosaminyl-phosphatidylinositol biosynthetic protein gpi1 isoform X1 [Arachis stenosperma]|uniref:N-acetylglucosaminyl-phosphatidylinositol biosynthetic protein gpi1 isoform X1 n=1 Tax=Arachis stenosperma TaxID=217475 RepID=UPI0025AC4C2B|nr:N-acetylglucosaminyl-phosphatidylinositol biosynthetic protein gpi1 isoform X1 [Arachis stenosperma]XP_057717817.1 N-acetylglucosaminyl-phosphatidylinositol biosynthetic protein gpi1 isoform X1 [Arachis stenosperma]